MRRPIPLPDRDVERLEYDHLKRIRYHFLEEWEKILEGLKSRLRIEDDWYEVFVRTKRKRKGLPSDLDTGAERIFHYVYASLLKNPNSSPIGADLVYETYDAFIHIDVKTISDSNIGDYRGKIALSPNQTSYPTHLYGFNFHPGLPEFYSVPFEVDGGKFLKPALTYFIYILHKHASEEIYSILLVSMLNGSLHEHYGREILQAGKTKDSVRFAFKNAPVFRLLHDGAFRVEFLLKSKKYSQEELTGIKDVRLPVWREV